VREAERHQGGEVAPNRRRGHRMRWEVEFPTVTRVLREHLFTARLTDRTISSEELGKHLEAALGLSLPARTLRRVLNRMGFRWLPGRRGVALETAQTVAARAVYLRQRAQRELLSQTSPYVPRVQIFAGGHLITVESTQCTALGAVLIQQPIRSHANLANRASPADPANCAHPTQQAQPAQQAHPALGTDLSPGECELASTVSAMDTSAGQRSDATAAGSPTSSDSHHASALTSTTDPHPGMPTPAVNDNHTSSSTNGTRTTHGHSSRNVSSSSNISSGGGSSSSSNISSSGNSSDVIALTEHESNQSDENNGQRVRGVTVRPSGQGQQRAHGREQQQEQDVVEKTNEQGQCEGGEHEEGSALRAQASWVRGLLAVWEPRMDKRKRGRPRVEVSQPNLPEELLIPVLSASAQTSASGSSISTTTASSAALPLFVDPCFASSQITADIFEVWFTFLCRLAKFQHGNSDFFLCRESCNDRVRYPPPSDAKTPIGLLCDWLQVLLSS
jgi:hypothetical protein